MLSKVHVALPFARVLLMATSAAMLWACSPSEPENPPSQDDDRFTQLLRILGQADPGFLVESGAQRFVPGNRLSARAPPFPPVLLVDDDAITRRVQVLLRRDSELSSFTVTVHTEDGVVTLSGIMPDMASRNRAETLAKFNDGVRSVNNLIEIGPPEMAQQQQTHHPAERRSNWMTRQKQKPTTAMLMRA